MLRERIVFVEVALLIPIKTRCLLMGAEIAAKKIVMELAPEVAKEVAKELAKKAKSSYGEIKLLIFLVMDFSELMKIDKWEIMFQSLITSKGAKRTNRDYVIDGIIRILDISEEIIPFPMDYDDFEDFEEEEVNIIDDSILLVKRVRIYAIPDGERKGSLSKAVVKIAEIVDNFMRCINLRKTYLGVRISFLEGGKASKFKKKIEEKIKKKIIDEETKKSEIDEWIKIYHEDSTIQLIVPNVTKILPVFEIVDEELYGGLLNKLKISKT